MSTPRTDGRVYMKSMRPLARVEEAAIIDKHFEENDALKKSIVLVRWAIQGISKDREVSPFIQARILVESGGIGDDELEQLWELIGKELGK